MNHGDDITLITVDCWRDDALDRMDQLQQVVSGWDQGSVICAGPHTGGAFPAIFASSYYPFVYEENGDIRDDIDTLPALLSEHGYSTGGFISSNPIVERWADHFDEWWNGGISGNAADGSSDPSLPSKIVHHLKLQPHVADMETLRRAYRWWGSQDGPRFLWIHLMGPHAPYLPGLKRGQDAGLIKSYLTLLLASKHPDNVNFHGDFPMWARRHLKSLYDGCIQRTDEVLSEWVPTFAEESTVIMMGDHGEEFDHGVLTHARLYDETVRVPIVTDGDSEIFEHNLVRQVDFAPALTAALGFDLPPGWDGTPDTAEFEPQPMIGSLSRYDQYWVGIRSEKWKLIKPYDEDNGFGDPEVYDVQEDPAEVDGRAVSDLPDSLRERFESFLTSDAIEDELHEGRGFVREVAPKVEGRLEELGYK